MLAPLFAAEMLFAYRKVASDETLTIRDMFAGFQRNSGALATLGVLLMLAMLVLGVLAFVLASGGLAGGLLCCCAARSASASP